MDITGVYTKTVFRNESNGYTIFKFKLNKPLLGISVSEITCKGTMQSALICTPMRLTGKLKHDGFGEFFLVEAAEPFSDDEAATIEYLSSKLFNGIAESTANKIVEITGPDVFSFAQKENARELLSGVKGLPSDKVDIFLNSIKYTQAQKEIFEFLSKYGGSFVYAESLFKQYGIKSIECLKTKPYETGAVVELPFRVCDCIAKDNGVRFDDLTRVRALAVNAIKRCYSSGDMYVLIDRLFNAVQYISKSQSAFPDDPISPGLVIAAMEDCKEVVIEIITSAATGEEEIRFYIKRAYFDERIIAENIARLLRSPQKFNIDIEKTIEEIEKSLNIRYSDKQKECFRFLLSSGIKIVTGGPGTGKSTVVNGLITAFLKHKSDAVVRIMAPTGRAAQRVSEITGLTAGTIHRMLNIVPYSRDMLDSGFDGDYPADVLIIDEVSMLDTTLARLLIKSIKSTALVILCGDINQLPSVGAGNVLHELISSHKIDTVQLDTNYRQKGKSTIIENAISVNSGINKLITDKSFTIIECEDANAVQKTVIREFINRYDRNKPYEVQVLSSTRKGSAGTFALNKEIQELINTEKTVTAHITEKFKLKDKIMTNRNNYDVGYFNGDIGIVKSADENHVCVRFLKEDIYIPKNCVQDMELAYACTVHKSQGSEYNTTIISLPSDPSVMLRRNLLYTAITRAKQEVIIVTEKGCISRSVFTVSDANRKSGLCEKIIKSTGGIR